MSNTRERSVTHISEMASADNILTRVGSAKIEKKQTILSSTSPSGTYSFTKSFVRLSSNIVSCIRLTSIYKTRLNYVRCLPLYFNAPYAYMSMCILSAYCHLFCNFVKRRIFDTQNIVFL